jgi:hypothetical protein
MPPPALWVHARHSGLVASFESGAHAQLLLWRALPRHRPRTTHPTTPAYPPFPRAGIKVTVGGKGAAGAPADSAADFRGAGRGIVWLSYDALVALEGAGGAAGGASGGAGGGGIGHAGGDGVAPDALAALRARLLSLRDPLLLLSCDGMEARGRGGAAAELQVVLADVCTVLPVAPCAALGGGGCGSGSGTGSGSGGGAGAGGGGAAAAATEADAVVRLLTRLVLPDKAATRTPAPPRPPDPQKQLVGTVRGVCGGLGSAKAEALLGGFSNLAGLAAAEEEALRSVVGAKGGEVKRFFADEVA